MINIIKSTVILASVLVLGACSSGLESGSGTPSGLGAAVKTQCGGNPANTDGSLMLTGKIQYRFYPAVANTNVIPNTLKLDYGLGTLKAVRCAQVDLILIDAQGQRSITNSVMTDLSGNYTFPANPNSTYDILIKSVLGTPTSANTQVIDHTDGNKIYAIQYGDINTLESDIDLDDLRADSRWDPANGHYYSGVTGDVSTAAHPAGPFAILDTILDAQRKVDGLFGSQLTSTTSFPGLTVTWAATPTTNALKTSFYQAGRLHILGDEDNDTDEYDRHVVAHEWGHYLVDSFSRDDSLGGSHGSFDYLDPTLAFSEGFANAFSAYATGEATYKDTGGTDQGENRVLNNLEADLVLDNSGSNKQTSNNDLDLTYEGLYSEDSVAEIILDILDSSNESGDSLSLPFSAVFTQLKGGHKDSPAFTSIVDFLFLLKANNSASASAIQTLATNENIGDILEFQSSGHAFSDLSLNVNDLYEYYTQVDTSGVPITENAANQTLEITDSFGSLNSDGSGNNKLFHRQFFVTVPDETACFKLSTDAVGINDIGIEAPKFFINATSSSASMNLNLTANTPQAFAVFANTPTEFSVKVERLADQCQ